MGISIILFLHIKTATALTVQQNELAGEVEYTICNEYMIMGGLGRASCVQPAISVDDNYIVDCGATDDSIKNMWNMSIVDLEILNGELYATIGLNYQDGTQVCKTADGLDWEPASEPSYGLFQGYDLLGVPIDPVNCLLSGTLGISVSSSSTNFAKSDVTGSMTLYTGGTGTSGCNGRGARVVRFDNPGWTYLVDNFVDSNPDGTNDNVGTNENGFGVSDVFFTSNFQAWSWAQYDSMLFTSIVRLQEGSRIMYTGTGAQADGSWTYSVGGDPTIPGGGSASIEDGFGDENTMGSILYTYKGSPSIDSVLFLGNFGNHGMGAAIWLGSGDGDALSWTQVTGDGFGDADIIQFDTFTEFNNTLYVSGSSVLASTIPGDAGTHLAGAKVYRMVSTGARVCGNGSIEDGEDCEVDTDCGPDQECQGCACVDVGYCGDGTVQPELGENCESDGDCGVDETCDSCRCTPTLVELASFAAAPLNAAVRITRSTVAEIDNAGFNLYRAESPEGPYIRINAYLIAAEGLAVQGASYTYVDTGLQNRKTYYYKLEDIDADGVATSHAPEVAKPRLIYGLLKK
ncbi:MAG: hypothetical protein GY850_38295 [bacterium]|nr:hypothetical protein [bacterium]